MEWFEDRGVALTTQEDNCVFPVSQDSQSVIDCFLSQTKILGIKIHLGQGIKSIAVSYTHLTLPTILLV